MAGGEVLVERQMGERVPIVGSLYEQALLPLDLLHDWVPIDGVRPASVALQELFDRRGERSLPGGESHSGWRSG
jgi:hypothetical protein